MTERRRLLILGGTGEAHALAARADALPGLHVVSSFAGRTQQRRLPKGEHRVGGFGGAGGLADYLQTAGIDLVVDATHPFASQISENAIEACARAGRPLVGVRRPEWRKQTGDRWIEVAGVEGAADAMAEHGGRIFVTVGRGEIGPFEGRPDLWLLVRLMEMGGNPPAIANGEIIASRGPFRVDDETRLMTGHRIDCLATKNSGGEATYAKIAASRALGLPVIMVRRPPVADAESVDTVEGAIDWLKARLV